ncbi:MAG: OmpA/MotB family protein [Galactobacter sp.]
MALGRQRRSADPSSDEPNYWMSFTDLMAGLVFVFILAIAALMVQLVQAQQDVKSQQRDFTQKTQDFSRQVDDLSQAEDMRHEMLIDIKNDLAKQGIQVIVAQNGSVISIPSDLLGFEKGQYDIEGGYKTVSLKIGTAIAESLRSDERRKYLDTVFVEGHTDSANFEGLEGTGNWGLSTFRAISLWRLWDEDLPKDHRLDSMTRADGEPLFSVSGYGQTRPIEQDQSTDTGAAKNRRIDIRFTIVRPDSDQLRKIEKKADSK